MAIYTHPANLELLKTYTRPSTDDGFTTHITSIPIYTDETLPIDKITGYQLPSNTRFIEYEESDLEWMIPLGIAKPIKELVFYETKGMMFDMYSLDGFSSIGTRQRYII